MILTEEQKMLQQQVRQIAKEVIAPRAAAIDESDEYPWDIFKVYAQQGLFELLVPTEYGGVGASHLSFFPLCHSEERS